MMLGNGFPDGHFTLEDVLAEEGRVVARWTFRATHKGELFGIPATGRPITIAGMTSSV